VYVDRDSFDGLRLVSGIPDPVLEILAETPVFGHHWIDASFVGIAAKGLFHSFDCDSRAPKATLNALWISHAKTVERPVGSLINLVKLALADSLREAAPRRRTTY